VIQDYKVLMDLQDHKGLQEFKGLLDLWDLRVLRVVLES